ncbi:hypothetical protein P4O66_001926 [Electrophorus voltai]|uniref:Reverse transcriptase/retrotransposon-derived protein RNase H-like domain-containing protein n=1 Tax=Electrophorus voltai TaxID=2609070 RepID=A0AAD9DT26_9TELE|nr:hypothetical protein P4O66_001926 [Electrophorus voltai]
MCETYGLSSAPSCRTTSTANWKNASSSSKSTVARPLTDLLHGTVKRLRWVPEAERSFSELKEAFSPVLQQPDPERPSVVEVDASNVGANREEHEDRCSLSATPRRGPVYQHGSSTVQSTSMDPVLSSLPAWIQYCPVYQHGSSTVTHLLPRNSELGPGRTDRGSKSASAMPAKPPLSHSASVKPLSCGHTPPWGQAIQEQPAWHSY